MRRPLMPMRRATRLAFAGCLCLVAACRDDGNGGDTAKFCGRVEENLEALRAVPQSMEEVDGLITLWKDVGDDAPLSIEPDWQAHILNFETALEGEDEEEMFARVYATERSSVAVATWITEHCGFEWGPVTTIVPQTTTTLTPPMSSPATG